MIRREITAPGVYALGHFLVDFCCASLMLRLQPDAWLFLAYNFCAFAVQMPVGLLADMLGNNKGFSAVGVALLLLACLPLPVTLRVTLVGLGNACYHVGGGRDALLKSNQMLRLGIFVAPGALGISLGALLNKSEILFYMATAAAALCAVVILVQNTKDLPTRTEKKPRISAAFLMFGVVLLRSFLGMTMVTPWKIGLWALAAGAAAAAGKALGGLVGDHLGSKRGGIFTLLVAAGLFCLPNSAFAGVLGLLFFNMTMPITLRGASDALPGLEGFAFGLLTFALFLGYIPAYFGLTIPWWAGAVLCLLSAALMGMEKRHD